MSQLVFLGTVTSVCDEYNGNRIRVKTPLDDNKNEPKEGYPYAFPLLPKPLQIAPKIGEMVFIILSNGEQRFSTRFYIGPIISQYQKLYEDNAGVLDNPACLLGSSLSNPLETLNHYKETFGSFPRVNDVSLLGRKGEDVILKDDEIDIRCGVRNHADGTENKGLIGDIIFNSSNPAYIQLKHLRGKGKLGNSLINMAGESINLMSEKDAQTITNAMKNFNNVKACVKENIEKEKNNGNDIETIKKYQAELSSSSFKEADYDAIINKLHQVPYGDVLVKVLEVMRNAIIHHSHPTGDDEKPFTENIPEMIALQTWGQSTDTNNAPDLSDILLSDTVRIS